MISAEFTVNGNANPAAHVVSYGSTVNLELLSHSGTTSISWSIQSCSDPDEPIPVITTSGTPQGRTASFVMPSSSGDDYGRTFLIKCSVSSEQRDTNGARSYDVKYGVIGAANVRGILPIAPGEENYRHGTHGWGPEVNIALSNTASGDGLPGADGADGTMVTASVDYCSTEASLTLSGSQTVDGAVPITGKRVLWAPPAGNTAAGVYVVNTSGSWTRSTDQDSSEDIDSRPLIQIKNGTDLAGRIAILSTPAPITLNTTVLVYQVSLKSPGVSDANKFFVVTSNGDARYDALSLRDSSGNVNPLTTSKQLVTSASLKQDIDADGNINIGRADSICLTDYPYNAVAATTATTVTGTAASASVTVASGTSFNKRDGVILLGAGSAHSMPAPPAPVATVSGTAGTLDRRYRIVARFEDQGMSAQSSEVTVSNAPDCLTDSIGAFLIRCDWASTGNISNLSAVPGTQDGITLRVGQDVLLKNQTTTSQNGIYRVSVNNEDGTFTIVRGSSMDTAGEATRGRRVHVSSGTVNTGKYFRISSASVVTLGTDPIVFEEVYVRIKPYGGVVDGVVKVNVANLAACPTAQPGYTLIDGYTVLLTAQTTTSQNGHYTVSGAGGGTCTLTRTTAFDSSAELPTGTFFRAARGTDALSCWVITTAAATVGSNPLLFTQLQVYQWDVYGRTGAGSYDYLGAMNANPLRDGTSTVLYDIYFDDIGAGALSRPTFIPSSPPAAARSNSLRARISSINGTAVVLDTVLGTSVSGVSFLHDNYIPITEAMSALSSNGRIIVPTGTFPVSGNIQENKSITWVGAGKQATIIKFASGYGWEVMDGAKFSKHSGMWLQSENQSVPCGGNYVSHDVSHFHGAMCLIRARCYWEDCIFSDSTNKIRGTGLAIVGRDVNSDNANCTKIIRCYADSCSGHGFVAYGSDVNQSSFDNCSSTSSEGWAFYDASFLGMDINACHASNGLRGGYITEEATAISKWSQCYTEAGQGASKIGTNTRVSGGDHGAGFWNPYTGSLTQGTYQNPFIVSTGSPVVERYVGSKNDNLVDRYSSGGVNGLDFRSGVENSDKLRREYFNTQITGGGYLSHGRHHEGNGNVEFQADLWVSSGYSASSGGGSNRVKIASTSAASNVPSFPNALYKKGSIYFDSTAEDLAFQVTRNFGLTSTSWSTASSKITGNLCKPTSPNGYVYAVTATSGATSGSTHATTEPTWPTTIGNSVVDNGVTWICYGYDAAISTVDSLPNYRAIGKRTVIASVASPGSITSTEVTQTVTGAIVGDDATVTPQADPGAGVGWCAWVSAADTIKLRLFTITGSPVTPNTVNWKFTARH